MNKQIPLIKHAKQEELQTKRTGPDNIFDEKHKRVINIIREIKMHERDINKSINDDNPNSGNS
tara:strand:- start:2184 stop:2372 length:189 start_codon:yes stop_codon:yes gene_type:complete